MAVGPDEALQRAEFAALRAHSGLTALIGGAKPRIFDRVPPSPIFPYVTIGEVDIIDDGHGCAAAWEAFVTTHVWSRDPEGADQVVGKTVAKRIGAQLQDALNIALTIDGFVCTEFQFRSSRYFFEPPDFLTAHGVIVHRYLIDPA